MRSRKETTLGAPQSAQRYAQLDAEMSSIENLGLEELKFQWLDQVSQRFDERFPDWKNQLDFYKAGERQVSIYAMSLYEFGTIT